MVLARSGWILLTLREEASGLRVEGDALPRDCEAPRGFVGSIGWYPNIRTTAWEALRVVESQVVRLEQEIDWMNESLKALDSFILPGGSPLSAHLHVARTVCRRAEREAVRLIENGEAVNVEAVKYLNRLSDHLFVAARRANANGASDIKWKPGATR